ncbi:p25-alpha family protein [Toxoplasma gondii]|uniref:p25-alpha family protein n=1 Tax=Toxoplasma gondii TaxID=5811 RepID=A0A7J6K674_TOXGO|nr:p25-alpha family protein [Toxoplasma gondii]
MTSSPEPRARVLDGKSLTSVDADLIFVKVKTKTARKIDYPQFEDALKLVAEKKKASADQIVTKIAASEGGPIFVGTNTEHVRLHDDKDTYTGIHKTGGPVLVAEGRWQFNNLSNICDRGEYDVRGVKKGVM